MKEETKEQDIQKLIGQKVKHVKFGEGVIVSVENDSDLDAFIFIDFKHDMKGPTVNKELKKLSLKYVINENNKVKFIDENIQKFVIDVVETFNNKQKIVEELEDKKRQQEAEEQRLKQVSEIAVGKYVNQTTKNSSDKTISSIFLTGKLQRGVAYGTVAKKIYDECCKEFGWDINKRGNFGRQQKLYAENAACEYSVWFLAHSNINASRGAQWSNVINGDTIEEEYMVPETYCDLNDVRITFYKDSYGRYLFAGIYKEDHKYKNNIGHMVIVYKKISDCYSI